MQLVLEEINLVLNVPEGYASEHWPLTAVYSKDLVAILRLLVAMARHFAPALRLTQGCHVTVLIIRKLNGVLQHRRQAELITETKDTAGALH